MVDSVLFKRISSVVLASAFALTANATVYRPGLLQAKFDGNDIEFKSSNTRPSLLSNLVENASAQLDYTYGTFMANMSVGSSTAANTNSWSGNSCAWNSEYTLFAYEGEIFLKEGQTVAMVGCFDDGSAAVVNGVTLFDQGSASGYNGGATCAATFTAEASGWYPVNAWVWDWSSGKNICKSYISGVQYNLAGITDDYTNKTKWMKLTDDGRMSLLRVPTDESFLVVHQLGTSGDDLKLMIGAPDLPANCPGAEVRVCWGAEDGGADTGKWDHVVFVGTIDAACKDGKHVMTAVGAAEADCVRVCLSYVDPEASDQHLVSSFEEWTECQTTLESFSAPSALGVVRTGRMGGQDVLPFGRVTYFGDGASSADVSVQFSATDDFAEVLVESAASTCSGFDALCSDIAFDTTELFGLGAGYIRLKLVNNLEAASYSDPIAYTAPSAIVVTDYPMKADFTVAADIQPVDDFQVLVRLRENDPIGFSYADCAADGSGIQFVSSDASFRYAFEIDTWNPEGESFIWVRLPSAAQGTAFTMLYGREGQQSESDGAKVWGDYAGVWHMSEPYGNLADSSGNGHTGIPTKGGSGTVSVDEMMIAGEGVVGSSRVNQDFNSNSAYWTALADTAQLELGERFTLSGWFRVNDRSGSSRLISRKKYYSDAEGFEIELSAIDKAAVRGGGNTQQTGTPGTFKDTWRYMTFIFNGTSLTIYGDGKSLFSGTIEAPTDNGRQIVLGGNSAGNETCLNGAYDEVRISRGAMSADRAVADYLAMVDADFLTCAGAISTSSDMPIVDGAEVAWGASQTEVTVDLASGKGAVEIVFTDAGNGANYRLRIADLLDATEGPETETYAVSTAQLPAGRVYSWRLEVVNEDLGRKAGISSTDEYYSGATQANVRYVATDGLDTNDGLLPASAMYSVQTAVDSLGADGGTVYVMPGEYAYNPTAVNGPLVTVTAPVVIAGYTGKPEDVVIRRATDVYARGFRLANESAVLRGVTVDGMKLLTANSENGGGLVIINGTVEDCVVCNTTGGHWDSRGLGAYMEAGRISRCVFRDNTMNDNANYGAAVYAKGGLVEDCLMTANTCNRAGAVFVEGTACLLNCTIAGNHGKPNTAKTDDVSGVATGTRNCTAKVVNCAIFDNSGSETAVANHANVWTGQASCFINCAAEVEIAGGVDCLVGFAGFLPDAEKAYHPSVVSCCYEAGVSRADYASVSTTDLDGNPRVSGDRVDIGCYEWQRGTFAAAFALSAEESLLSGATVTGTAMAADAEGTVTYCWDFDNDGTPDRTTTEATVQWTFPAAGYYTVKLTASDGDSQSSYTLENAFYAAPDVIYVDAANAANSVFPYSTLETATTDLQEALDIARDGTKIWVADGVYTRSAGVDKGEDGFTVTNAVTLRSISGMPEQCKLTNAVRSYWGDAGFRHRCLVVNNRRAFASGFLLENGSCEQDIGGCLYIGELGGVVSNCVIRGGYVNNWSGNGPGAYLKAGLLTHTIIEDCENTKEIRQHTHGVLAVEGGVAENCLVRNNLKHNQNMITVYKAGKIRNCTVVNGKCRSDGLYNNTDFYSGGVGIYADSGAEVVNSVVVGVTRPGYDDPEQTLIVPWRGAAASFVNCATDGDTPINGTCFLVDTTAFADYANGDYQPAKTGALIGRGADVQLSSTTDLNGQPRLVGHSIDIGCYECQGAGLLISIR